jgi:hypothetical protein
MKEKKKKKKNVKMKEGKCTHIANTDKDCHLLHGRTILSSGRTPHYKQNLKCLDYSQNMVMRPGGAQRQEGLTD